MISPRKTARLWDVVGVGENSVDTVLHLPALPRADDPTNKLRISSRAIHCGGQVATMLGACAALGLRSAYVGAIGSDANGTRLAEALTAAGIDITHAVVGSAGGALDDAANRAAVILVDDRTGDRIVLWDRGAALALTADDVSVSLMQSARAVHVDATYMDASLRAAAAARTAGALVTTDVDRVVDGVDTLVELATHPIVSEHFLAEFAGTADPVEGLRRLRQRTPALLVATLGAGGAVALDGDQIVRAPGFAVTAVDTTGAGDVFRGAFVAALLEPSLLRGGSSLADHLRFANAAAAASCRKSGALAGVPTRADIEAVMNREAHQGA